MNNELSLEAQEALKTSELKRRSYWPLLRREETILVLERPHRFRRGGAKAFADYIRNELPLFKFDSKRNFWMAQAKLEAWEQIVDKFTIAKELQVRLDEEVKIWADCAKFAKKMHEEIAADGGEPAHTCKVNAAHYRQKAARFKGKLRQYYLGIAADCERHRQQILAQKPDSELSCAEWRERHDCPCGGHKTGCGYCPAEK